MRCVLLHGFAGDPASWSDVGIAGERIALPGHAGRPVLPTWDDNIAALGHDIAGCDVVIGYSLGARVALALHAADFAPRAILISVNPGLADDADRAARRANDAAWAARLRERGIADFITAWEAQPLFATQSRAPAERLAARRARRLALDPELLARSLEVMGLAEMPDYRSAITPERILLVAGADDPKYVAIARSLPAPLELIAHAGHDPLLEQPEAVREIWGRWNYGR